MLAMDGRSFGHASIRCDSPGPMWAPGSLSGLLLSSEIDDPLDHALHPSNSTEDAYYDLAPSHLSTDNGDSSTSSSSGHSPIDNLPAFQAAITFASDDDHSRSSTPLSQSSRYLGDIKEPSMFCSESPFLSSQPSPIISPVSPLFVASPLPTPTDDQVFFRYSPSPDSSSSRSEAGVQFVNMSDISNSGPPPLSVSDGPQGLLFPYSTPQSPESSSEQLTATVRKKRGRRLSEDDSVLTPRPDRLGGNKRRRLDDQDAEDVSKLQIRCSPRMSRLSQQGSRKIGGWKASSAHISESSASSTASSESAYAESNDGDDDSDMYIPSEDEDYRPKKKRVRGRPSHQSSSIGAADRLRSLEAGRQTDKRRNVPVSMHVTVDWIRSSSTKHQHRDIGITPYQTVSTEKRPGRKPRLPAPVVQEDVIKTSRGRKVPAQDDLVTELLEGEDGVFNARPVSGGVKLEAGERRYMCIAPGCGKCFLRGEHLKRHVRSLHSWNKPHVCPYAGCDKSFSRRDNLAQHIRLHV